MKREELHFDEDGLIIDVIIPNLNQELMIDKNYDSDFDIENQLDFAKHLIDILVEMMKELLVLEKYLKMRNTT